MEIEESQQISDRFEQIDNHKFAITKHIKDLSKEVYELSPRIQIAQTLAENQLETLETIVFVQKQQNQSTTEFLDITMQAYVKLSLQFSELVQKMDALTSIVAQSNKVQLALQESIEKKDLETAQTLNEIKTVLNFLSQNHFEPSLKKEVKNAK